MTTKRYDDLVINKDGLDENEDDIIKNYKIYDLKNEETQKF